MEGGEITLSDGTTKTVAPGTTIDPLTGEITPPRDEAKGGENPGGGCDAGMAGFALLAMAMIAASAARKKAR
ncbi:MAG: hypothetical protein LBF92_06440 [Synergistaceae bacterium]|jgi:hypothetical protein|nr:hypothetical protein [Synergistaceae bacterium]